MAQVDTIFNLKYFHEKYSSGEKQQKWYVLKRRMSIHQRLVFIGDKLNLASTLTETSHY